MELAPELSRLAKMLIDAEGITGAQAEARLRAMTLEIVVGLGADSSAAQNAILTAIAVGQRTFVGGVRVILAKDAKLISSLPIGAASLREAISMVGATVFEGAPSARIAIGRVGRGMNVGAHAWWADWKAGSSSQPRACGGGENPLAGIVAGASSVGRAFAKICGNEYPPESEFDLWPKVDGREPPAFGSVYFPGALWLLGLGNLGQAIMWSLSALPYQRPSELNLVLQDRDQVTAENWGTSVLVRPGDYGDYKTAAGEQWGKARGFDVRRVDRWLDERQHVQDGDPRMAICGFDNIDARKKIDGCGFDVVIDAGLGRKHSDYDVFKVTIFDRERLISDHFRDAEATELEPPHDYERLLGLDACGAAVFHGIAVAAPFVSAIAGATVVTRAIAISSGAAVPRNQVRRLSWEEPRTAAAIEVSSRSLLRVRQ